VVRRIGQRALGAEHPIEAEVARVSEPVAEVPVDAGLHLPSLHFDRLQDCGDAA
jgi:hypothetical protein